MPLQAAENRLPALERQTRLEGGGFVARASPLPPRSAGRELAWNGLLQQLTPRWMALMRGHDFHRG